MCKGQLGALPNTHSTITATLIVETSNPSIVLVAPNPTLNPESTTKTSRITGTQSSKTLAPSTLSSPAVTSSTVTSSTSIPSAASTQPTSSSAPGASLTKYQIAGIAGGGALAIAIVVGGLFICRYNRKRKQRDARDSDMLPFQIDPDDGTDSKSKMQKSEHKYLGPGGTANGKAARIPPRIPLRVDNYDLNMFSRRSIRPDTIGLAISAELQEPNQHDSSVLLQEKPTLKVKIPTIESGNPTREDPNYFRQEKPIYGQNRESTTTQFEEDLESAKAMRSPTSVRGSRFYGGGENIVSYNWKTFQNSGQGQLAVAPTLSETAGAGSPWRSGQGSNNAGAGADFHIRPLTIERAAGSPPLSRQPTVPVIQPLSQQLQIGPLPKLEIPTQVSRPITSSSIYSTRTSLPPSETGRISSSNNRNSGRGKRKSFKQTGPYDQQRQSQGSLTSFETIDSATDQPEPRTAELSPVVESPASGRSPVTYPKIPKRLSGNIANLPPPPPQPDFTRPWRQAEPEGARVRRYDQERSNRQEASLHPPYENGIERSPRHLAPAPLTLMKVSSSPFDGGYQPEIPEELRLAGIEQPRSASAASGGSTSTTGSSLLAKRRGSKKAAELALKREEDVRKQQKWRVLRDEDIEAAKNPDWRPQLAGGSKLPQGSGQLPSTPGWVPRLTPTRRGDDLFLSVQ